jgi:hypothetical protein
LEVAVRVSHFCPHRHHQHPLSFFHLLNLYNHRLLHGSRRLLRRQRMHRRRRLRQKLQQGRTQHQKTLKKSEQLNNGMDPFCYAKRYQQQPPMLMKCVVRLFLHVSLKKY